MPIAPRGHAEAAAACRAFAEQTAWSDDILNHWPTVIAHEYWRLREELREGRAYGAMLQLKDLAEVLVKLPVITAARLLVAFGNDAQRQPALKLLVAYQPATLGTWCSEGRFLLQEAAALPHAAPWLAVLHLLASPSGTTLNKLGKCIQNDVLPWRNEELAHGALKLNLEDSMPSFQLVLSQFLAALPPLASSLYGVQLQTLGEAPLVLRGAGGLDDQAAAQAAMAGQNFQALAWVPCAQADATPPLNLGGYACLKTLAGPQGQPAEVFAFLLNKRLHKRGRPPEDDRLALLDYGSGQPHTTHAAEAGPGLAADLASQPARPDAEATALREDRDLQDEPVRAFLDQVSFQNAYLSPGAWRQWLGDFVAAPSRDRGLAWLEGPADVGKTLFCLGLDTLEHGVGTRVLADAMPRRLAPDLHVIVVPLRREYRSTPASLGWQVLTSLFRAPDREALSLDAYLKGAETAAQRAAGFCEWLRVIYCEAAYRHGPHQRLLLVVDAMDEMPAPEPGTFGNSIHELVPGADQLPPGVFVLFTSRGRGLPGGLPEDECPPFVHEALSTAFNSSPPELVSRFTLDPNQNPDYAALLHQFFEQQWALAESRLRQEGRTLPAPEQRSALCAATLAAANHRFKAFAYFSTLLVEGLVQAEDLDGLSQAPLQAHLRALEQHEPPKRFARMRTLLLELAAAEEAYLAEMAYMAPLPMGLVPQWLGLDLLELARRCGEAAERPSELEPSFVSTLYSLAPLLRSYRGEAAASSRFALGIKGMLGQLGALDGWSTGPVHLRLMWEAFEDYEIENSVNSLLKAVGHVIFLSKASTSEWGPEMVHAIDSTSSLALINPAILEKTESLLMICALGESANKAICEQPVEKYDVSCYVSAVENYHEWVTRRASLLLDLSYLKEATEAFSVSLDHLHASLVKLGLYIDCLINLDDRARAIESFYELAISKARAHTNLGISFRLQRSLKKSRDEINLALEIFNGLPSYFRGRLDVRKSWSVSKVELAQAEWLVGAVDKGFSDLDDAVEIQVEICESVENKVSGLKDFILGEFRAAIHPGFSRREDSYILFPGGDVDGLSGQRRDLVESNLEFTVIYENRLVLSRLVDIKGRWLLKMGDLDSAASIFSLAIGCIEDIVTGREERACSQGILIAYASYLMNRGVCYSEMSRHFDAIEDFSTGIELLSGQVSIGGCSVRKVGPLLAKIMLNRGCAYSVKKNYIQAIEDLNGAYSLLTEVVRGDACESTPALVETLICVHLNRGIVLDLMGKSEAALCDFDDAVKHGEDLRENYRVDDINSEVFGYVFKAYINRGQIKKFTGSLLEAVADFDQAINWGGCLGDIFYKHVPLTRREELAMAYGELRETGSEKAGVGEDRATEAANGLI